jgi:hypothetical protein
MNVIERVRQAVEDAKRPDDDGGERNGIGMAAGFDGGGGFDMNDFTGVEEEDQDPRDEALRAMPTSSVEMIKELVRRGDLVTVKEKRGTKKPSGVDLRSKSGAKRYKLRKKD